MMWLILHLFYTVLFIVFLGGISSRNSFHAPVWNNGGCRLQAVTPIEEVLSARRREEQKRRWLDELDKQREETSERRRREKQLQSQVPAAVVLSGRSLAVPSLVHVFAALSARGPPALGFALSLPAEEASRPGCSSHSCPTGRLWAARVGAHVQAVAPLRGRERGWRGERQRRRCGDQRWALNQSQVQGRRATGRTLPAGWLHECLFSAIWGPWRPFWTRLRWRKGRDGGSSSWSCR